MTDKCFINVPFGQKPYPKELPPIYITKYRIVSSSVVLWMGDGGGLLDTQINV